MIRLTLISLFLFFLLSFTKTTFANFGARECSEHRLNRDGFTWDERRGQPWEFDAGPSTKDSESWLKLYGQVPNYRAVGRKILSSDEEKFRWTMGPMWYRGRLGKNQVKVFVVGQEGAQDENVTNRAFTGSTGTRVQKFLNHLGIYESYLFMNTFIYTIRDQRDTASKAYMALEQSVESPIVKYRHQLFDNVIEQNPNAIALFIGVGGGGKESLATWINSKSQGSKKCHPHNDLEDCDLSDFIHYFKKQGTLTGNEKILAIGVPHPGGAAFGSGTQGLEKSFSKAAKRVSEFIEKNNQWLPEDSEEKNFSQCAGGARLSRLNENFRYGHSPIPFRDFSFATNWRMGDTGTSSNRNGSDKIQVFSEHGRYAIVRNPAVPLGEWRTTNGRTVFNDEEPIYEEFYPPRETSDQVRDQKRGLLYEMKETEVPYEPPRYSEYGFSKEGDLEHAAQFDPGPATEEMAQALMNWPNFKELNPKGFWSDPSFGFGPSYRGNTLDPKVVILADQMGHTDFFSTRALTGVGGQRLQAFLNESGLNDPSSYLILRSLPVDTLGISLEEKLALVVGKDRSDQSVQKTLTNILKEIKNDKILLAMGPLSQTLAKKLAEQYKELGLTKIISMAQPDDNYNHVSQWLEVAEKAGLGKLNEKSLKSMPIIPRKDLPYSTRWWMGTTGERGERAYGQSLYEREVNQKEFDYTGHYYQLVAPDWTKRLWDDPRPLNSVEIQEVNNTLNSF